MSEPAGGYPVVIAVHAARARRRRLLQGPPCPACASPWKAPGPFREGLAVCFACGHTWTVRRGLAGAASRWAEPSR